MAGSIASFAANSVTAFPEGRFFLVRLEDGSFMALSRECTHLGCTVQWDQDAAQFLCPCHSSIFNLKGEVLRRPAPRALDYLAVKLEQGQVRVDLSSRARRQTFKNEQTTHV